LSPSSWSSSSSPLLEFREADAAIVNDRPMASASRTSKNVYFPSLPSSFYCSLRPHRHHHGRRPFSPPWSTVNQNTNIWYSNLNKRSNVRRQKRSSCPTVVNWTCFIANNNCSIASLIHDTFCHWHGCVLHGMFPRRFVGRSLGCSGTECWCRDTGMGKLAHTTASPGRPAMTSPLNQEIYQDLDIGKCQKRTMTAPATIINVEQSQLSMPDADVRCFCWC
jgi:hypothetical protein